MTEWQKNKPLGDWGEWFFEQHWQKMTFLHGDKACLIEMDHDGKSGDGYAGKYGKIGQEAGMDFLEIRDRKDGTQYAHAFEIKTDNGALWYELPEKTKYGTPYNRPADKTEAINAAFRPYEGTAETTPAQRQELRQGWGNLFIETVQNVDRRSEGWYTIVQRNKAKLNKVFPREARFPHIEGRDIVEVLVRPDGNGEANAYFLFIPDTTLISIVRRAVKKLRLEPTPGGGDAKKSLGYKVPIPQFYARKYKKAFAKLRIEGDKPPFLPEDAEAVTVGRWERRFKKGVRLYVEHMTAEDVKVYVDATEGKFTKPPKAQPQLGYSGQVNVIIEPPATDRNS